MIPYASRTGSRRNLDVLRRAGWRLLVSAAGVWRTEGFKYAIDNGAWTAYQQGEPFDGARFTELVELLGDGADWIVVPDIVAGGLRSLNFSESWIPHIEKEGRLLLLPVQDGMEPEHIRELVSPDLGIFLGGTTEWKELTIGQWGRLAHERGAYYHVGRVNSAKRIKLCHLAGANSFDGTSVTMYSKTLPLLDNARRQLALGDEWADG